MRVVFLVKLLNILYEYFMFHLHVRKYPDPINNLVVGYQDIVLVPILLQSWLHLVRDLLQPPIDLYQHRISGEYLMDSERKILLA